MAGSVGRGESLATIPVIDVGADRHTLALDNVCPRLQPTVLNRRTRLVFAAEPASGAFVARGYDVEGPTTNVLQATA